ncbi:NADP-dependent oxidoreductase [Virgibacillus sediminis]|uniref:NADP-dependent oxidoreductase n=1 Tax=Virgibacillus sediminis TaxID=202260 RepID=A0ABV7A2K3_9BACI
MKAIVINEYGNVSKLKEQEMPTPDLGEKQVLVEMHATSVNPIDWKAREGYLQEKLPFDFPIILGWDAAGVVAGVGSQVKNFAVGDRVFARPDTTNRGTYAEYTVVDENLLARIPEEISYEEAAAAPLTALTAWQCLVDFSNVKKGDKVLIHAGSGGVGSYAIQLAKHFGAYVATTASGRNEEFVKELGADQFINYQEEDFEQALEDFDIVVDTLGGEAQQKSFSVLKEGGKLVSIVEPPEETAGAAKRIKSGFHWLEPDGRQLAEIAALMVTGEVKSHVGHKFPLTEEGVKEAHKLSESGHAKGKIVINIK